MTLISEIERAEIAIVDHLKARLGAHVRIEAQPDDPDRFDFAGASSAVLVHFAQSTPSAGNRVKLAGPVGFAVIVLARSLRGPGGGYQLLENAEQTLAGADIAGLREIAVKRSRLDSQSGGTWRWVIEVETELARGRVPSFAKPFVTGFQESAS
ncbi:Gp37 family protein [Aurantimonas sp. C2-6-R+9]|uniref:Gp37 family protein n=1 Tax=unclassified Aurantimonas TaxID=2638230 RepID=UPI002E18997D|nr:MULTISPECIES: Gp37 family protein [unclassified Aurantimonas]MEC5291976.1 Gp37 family protein [Aurantimonas sp. C2-3-R2]MEC5382088.1 Gp37 family protein [Aurantimonas sp. C2-6-R+9]MEC5413061.1 Gp37 family protein [Aurantimonas sp. C2-4-R8]